jgi:hypothetical protein
MRNAVAVGAAWLASVVPMNFAVAEQPATTLQTLLDKQQIQDLLVDYYANLGNCGGHAEASRNFPDAADQCHNSGQRQYG